MATLPLPETFKQLLQFFEIIDKIYSFVTKVHIPFNISNIRTLMKSFGILKTDEQIFDSAFKLSYICPEFLCLSSHQTDVQSVIPTLNMDYTSIYILYLIYQGVNKVIYDDDCNQRLIELE